MISKNHWIWWKNVSKLFLAIALWLNICACLSKGAQLHHVGAENHRYVDPAEVCRRRRHLSRNSCTTLRNVLLLVQRVQAFYILLEYATIIAPSGNQAFWNFGNPGTKSDYCNWSGIVLRYLWSSAGLPGESPFIGFWFRISTCCDSRPQGLDTTQPFYNANTSRTKFFSYYGFVSQSVATYEAWSNIQKCLYCCFN